MIADFNASLLNKGYRKRIINIPIFNPIRDPPAGGWVKNQFMIGGFVP
jgi:hypothetical protein